MIIIICFFSSFQSAVLSKCFVKKGFIGTRGLKILILKDSPLILLTNLSFITQSALALSINMLTKIWKPDTVVFNGRKSYLHTITQPNIFVR